MGEDWIANQFHFGELKNIRECPLYGAQKKRGFVKVTKEKQNETGKKHKMKLAKKNWQKTP